MYIINKTNLNYKENTHKKKLLHVYDKLTTKSTLKALRITTNLSKELFLLANNLIFQKHFSLVEKYTDMMQRKKISGKGR